MEADAFGNAQREQDLIIPLAHTIAKNHRHLRPPLHFPQPLVPSLRIATTRAAGWIIQILLQLFTVAVALNAYGHAPQSRATF